MRYILLAGLLIAISCAPMPRKRLNKAEPKPPVKSYHDIRQDKIRNCTLQFIQKGVDFSEAVKGCKEDIYYK